MPRTQPLSRLAEPAGATQRAHTLLVDLDEAAGSGWDALASDDIVNRLETLRKTVIASDGLGAAGGSKEGAAEDGRRAANELVSAYP